MDRLKMGEYLNNTYERRDRLNILEMIVIKRDALNRGQTKIKTGTVFL